MSFESDLQDLGDPSTRLSATQLVNFSDLDAIETARFAEIWPSLSDSRRLSILEALIELAEDNVDLNFDAIYKLALRDEAGAVRAAAVRGLEEYEARDLIPVLIEILHNDPEAAARRESAVALGRYALAAELDQIAPDDAALVREALIQSAENVEEDERVRARAIEALGAMSGEETDNLIESVYQEDSLWLKVGAVDAMGRSCNAAWLPTVLHEMENRAPEMRHAAAYAAGEIGEEEAVAPLKRLAIQDPDREVQLAAVRALGVIGGRRAMVALKSILYEGDDDLRDAVQDAMREVEFSEDPLRQP
jgi:HEAT repeat protein